MIRWHAADFKNRMYCNLKDGKKIAMPRYYKEKVFDEYQRIMAGKYQREKMLEEESKLIKKLGIDEYRRKKLNEHLGIIKKFNHQNRKQSREKI